MQPHHFNPADSKKERGNLVADAKKKKRERKGSEDPSVSGKWVPCEGYFGPKGK